LSNLIATQRNNTEDLDFSVNAMKTTNLANPSTVSVYTLPWMFCKERIEVVKKSFTHDFKKEIPYTLVALIRKTNYYCTA
jgi:protein-disulfide isomerase